MVIVSYKSFYSYVVQFSINNLIFRSYSLNIFFIKRPASLQVPTYETHLLVFPIFRKHCYRKRLILLDYNYFWGSYGGV